MLSVETADGRKLVTSFRDDTPRPQIDDLLDAWRFAWREASAGGRRSEQEERIERIVATAVQLGDDATRDLTALTLQRANEWGEPRSDYKRDVTAAGGWDEIMRRARRLRDL